MSLEVILRVKRLSGTSHVDCMRRVMPVSRQLVLGGGGKYPSGSLPGFLTSFYKQPVLPRECGSELFHKCLSILFGWLKPEYGMTFDALEFLIGRVTISRFNIGYCECAIVGQFDSCESCDVECGRDCTNQVLATIGTYRPKKHQFSLSRKRVGEAQFTGFATHKEVKQIVRCGSWDYCG